MRFERDRKLVKMFSYSTMAMSYGIMINFLNVNIFNFYTDEVLLNINYIPIIMTIYAVWNALNDPLFGLISDKIKTPWGRRFPFILFGFIPFTLSFLALWFLPPSLIISKTSINTVVGYSNFLFPSFISAKSLVLQNTVNILFQPYVRAVNHNLIFVYMVSFLLIFDTLFTMVVMSWQTLFPEKFKEDKERSYVAAITQTIRLLGIVFALVFPPLLIEYGDIDSYKLPIIILVVAVLIGFLLSLYGSRDEKIVDSEETEEEEEEEKKGRTNLQAIIDVLKNKNLIAFAVAIGMSNIAFLILMAMVRYMNKWVLVQEAQYETYINAIAFAVGLLTFIVWVKISIKRGPKLVYIASGALFFISLLPLAFAGEGWGWVVLILMVFVGFSISGLLLIPDILLAEIIDEDVQKSGEKREGLIYGIYGFAIRIAIVFESYLITFVLKRTKFDPLASEQTPLAKTGIKVLMVGVPAICFIIGILLMIFYYDLSRKKIEKKYNRKFSKFH
ncbi:MAG: MFS transporter [Candidatus Heimdallarchaeota archaeon]|nr:MFS transporter [Candidatus Heimdallarchaeota archaeon]MCK4770378.1 MFS transporter [Candidatus Heimdallarchaeota archaeon]